MKMANKRVARAEQRSSRRSGTGERDVASPPGGAAAGDARDARTPDWHTDVPSPTRMSLGRDEEGPTLSCGAFVLRVSLCGKPILVLGDRVLHGGAVLAPGIGSHGMFRRVRVGVVVGAPGLTRCVSRGWSSGPSVRHHRPWPWSGPCLVRLDGQRHVVAVVASRIDSAEVDGLSRVRRVDRQCSLGFTLAFTVTVPCADRAEPSRLRCSLTVSADANAARLMRMAAATIPTRNALAFIWSSSHKSRCR